MRYITFRDDKMGRLQLELLWEAACGNQDRRSREEQRAHGRLLDKLEAVTDAVPADVTCNGCGKVLASLPVDMPEQRTIAEGSGSRALALEETEHRIALACLQPDKIGLVGRRVRINEALLTLLEQAPAAPPPTP